MNRVMNMLITTNHVHIHTYIHVSWRSADDHPRSAPRRLGWRHGAAARAGAAGLSNVAAINKHVCIYIYIYIYICICVLVHLYV